MGITFKIFCNIWVCSFSEQNWIQIPVFHPCLQSIYIFVILIFHVVILVFWSILYTKAITCLSVLEVSSIFPPLKEFFLIRFDGLRKEGAVCCTDCEALWGKFVILGYIQNIKLTWLDFKTMTLHENGHTEVQVTEGFFCCVTPHLSSSSTPFFYDPDGFPIIFCKVP